MTLRRIAGLLAAFGLTLGLIGGGVGAVFTDTLTATENINVGTFACVINDATPGAIIAGDRKSVSYTAPTINSSAAGNAPFFFEVSNAGSIAANLTVSTSPVSAPFSIIGAPFAAVPLPVAGTHTYNTGVSWGALTNANLGTSGSVTWTVNCGEVPAAPDLPANTYVFVSTNANNIAQGWAHVTAVPGTGSVTLTFTQPRGHVACFEWRTDGNVPEQRLGPGEVVGATPFLSNYLGAGINDGLYRYVCPGHPEYGMAGATDPNPTVVVVPVTQYVEVRLSFGGEADERFDWTRFDAMP